MAVLIDAKNDEFNKKLKQSENNFRGFTTSINKLGGTLGVALGGAAVFSGLKQAQGIASEFEATMSEVKAITGAVGNEFKQLEDDAKRLGASTKFTANEVGQLQVAYGRLGFTTKEIVAATSATLDLAAATGEDLAKSADVAGSTVRGFGLGAEETQRVVDVMAASFNKTALGLDNFTESMKYVAPIAAAAGASLEETTALLGVLADAGIRGSMAGTSLRKIFTDMSKDGRPLQERLKELADKGITLSDAFDEVGRTAQTSLLILANNTDKTNDLALAFTNVAGEAKKMALVMSDNLAGDVDKLTGAFSALFIKLSQSDALRGLTQNLTAIANILATGTTPIDSQLEQLAKVIKELGDAGSTNRGPIEFWTESVKELRRELGKDIEQPQIDFLIDKYKLTSEQAGELVRIVGEVNKALSFQEAAIKNFNEFAAQGSYKTLADAAEAYKTKLYELIFAEQVQRDQLRVTGKDGEEFVTKSTKQIEYYTRLIDAVNEYIATQKKLSDSLATTTPQTVETLATLEAQSKSLKDQLENTPTGDILGLQALQKKIDAVASRIAYIKMLIDGFTTDDLRPATFSGAAEDVDFPGEDMVPEIDSTTDHLEKLNEEMYKFLTTQEGFAQYGAAFIDMSAKIKEESINLSGVVNSAISGIGQALGRAITGSQDLGDALLGVLGGVLVQLGEMIIAAGVGTEAFKASLESLNGYAAIAAGLALVALGSALSSSISSLGSNPTGSVSGGGRTGATNPSVGNGVGANGWEIKLSGEWEIDGDKLRYIINRNAQLTKRTR